MRKCVEFITKWAIFITTPKMTMYAYKHQITLSSWVQVKILCKSFPPSAQLGLIRSTELAIKHMRKDEGGNGGTIINIGSVAGRSCVRWLFTQHFNQATSPEVYRDALITSARHLLQYNLIIRGRRHVTVTWIYLIENTCFGYSQCPALIEHIHMTNCADIGPDKDLTPVWQASVWSNVD